MYVINSKQYLLWQALLGTSASNNIIQTMTSKVKMKVCLLKRHQRLPFVSQQVPFSVAYTYVKVKTSSTIAFCKSTGPFFCCLHLC